MDFHLARSFAGVIVSISNYFDQHAGRDFSSIMAELSVPGGFAIQA